MDFEHDGLWKVSESVEGDGGVALLVGAGLGEGAGFLGELKVGFAGVLGKNLGVRGEQGAAA